MKTLERVMKDLIGRGVDEIVETFEDYEFEGVSSIIVTNDNDNIYMAYADHRKSPIVMIKVEDDIIVEAWS